MTAGPVLELFEKGEIEAEKAGEDSNDNKQEVEEIRTPIDMQEVVVLNDREILMEGKRKESSQTTTTTTPPPVFIVTGGSLNDFLFEDTR